MRELSRWLRLAGRRSVLLGLVIVAALLMAREAAPGGALAQQARLTVCPPAGGWAMSVWSGPDGTSTGQAVAICTQVAVSIVYWLDPTTQTWLAYFAGAPEFLNTLQTLNNLQPLLLRGGEARTPTPTPAATPTLTPAPTIAPLPVTATCIDYSDGVYEGQSANEQGQALAVLFAPPSVGRWQVTQLRYQVVSNPVPFEAAIFSVQQQEVVRQRVQTVSVGLVQVDLTPRNVVVEGDFYGAIIHIQGTSAVTGSFGPFIGRDGSDPDGRSWVTKPGGVWKTWRQEDIDQGFGLGDGDFGIVACVRGPL